MLRKRKPPELVISEPDIEAALDHLQTLPYRLEQPRRWDRQRLLNRIRGSLATAQRAVNATESGLVYMR
uniref:Uncharacterized protein n=1 Tax=Aeromonas salmonicida subsp. salmonicida TaxID=29491 RepID=A0A1Z3MNC5_AERSS|nr:hypothetical protein [Aeromonas salmonicida subsp. salmonicida]